MVKRGASGEALHPRFSILNPEFTATLPAYQTACGITDIMIHVCERYFTNTEDVEITDDDTLYGQVKGLGERLAKATGLDELADDFGDLWDRIVGRT